MSLDFWYGFGAGAGLTLGALFLASLCVAASRADEAAEQGERARKLNPPDDVTDQEWMYAEQDGHLPHGGTR